MSSFSVEAVISMRDHITTPVKGVVNSLRDLGRRASDTSKEIDNLGESAEDAAGGIEEAGDEAQEAQGKFGKLRSMVGLMTGQFSVASAAAVGLGAAVVAGAAAGTTAIAGMLKETAKVEYAISKLQAQTGMSKAQMADIQDIVSTVYRGGFGEDYEQVAESVALLRQQLKGLSKDRQTVITQGLMTQKELFDFDPKEVTRTIKGMTANFKGLKAEEALDLITFGKQKGGDYYDDLLDTLNEYSVQFASLGLNAEQMMGILLKGSEAGAWNMDKVGDSVKEFNLRAQDGSKTTIEGFELIGMNADDMAKKIAGGGKGAEQAFFATISALAAMKDPVKQNTAGVALFGTQWEDMRKKVISAMIEGRDGLEEWRGSTKKASDELQDNLIKKITQLKREFIGAFTDGSEPLNESLTKLVDNIKTKMPSIKKAIAEVFEPFKNEKLSFGDQFEQAIGIATKKFDAYMKGEGGDELRKVAVTTAKIGTEIGIETGKAVLSGAISAIKEDPIASVLAGVLLGLAFPGGPVIKAAVAAGTAIVLALSGEIEKGLEESKKRQEAILKDQYEQWQRIDKLKDETPNDQPMYKNPTTIKPREVSAWESFKNTTNQKIKSVLPNFPGFKTGLGRVPYDDMVVRVHKDEAILTAGEADEYRKDRATYLSNTTNHVSNSATTTTKHTPVHVHYHASSGSTDSEFQRFFRQFKSAMSNMG